MSTPAEPTLTDRIAAIESAVSQLTQVVLESSDEAALRAALVRIEQMPSAVTTLRSRLAERAEVARHERFARIAAMTDVGARNAAIDELDTAEQYELLHSVPAEDAIRLVVEHRASDALSWRAPAALQDRIEAMISILPKRMRLGPVPSLPSWIELTREQAYRLEDVGLRVERRWDAFVHGRTYTDRPSIWERRQLDVLRSVDRDLDDLIRSGQVECRPLTDGENVAYQCALWRDLPRRSRDQYPRKTP